MGICRICKKKRPDEFLSILFSTKGDLLVDPECARKRIAKIHGLQNYHFTGEYAQQLWEDFMEWKKKNEGGEK